MPDHESQSKKLINKGGYSLSSKEIKYPQRASGYETRVKWN